MNTTNQQQDMSSNFHIRVKNIIDDNNKNDIQKSESIIKVLNKITDDIANLSFSNKDEFDEYIGKNLGDDMRKIVRKIGNSATLIHDDQFYQLVSIMAGLHMSATASLLISHDMIGQMNMHKVVSVNQMKAHFDTMKKQFSDEMEKSIGQFGIKMNNTNLAIQKNLDAFDEKIKNKQIEHANGIGKILDETKQRTLTECANAVQSVKKAVKDMDDSTQAMFDDFKSQKERMEQETLDKLNNDLARLFVSETKRFFNNLKVYLLIGAGGAGSLATLLTIYIVKHWN